jgi:hypothetical protein
MALKTAITDPRTCETFANGYWRLRNLRGDKRGLSAELQGFRSVEHALLPTGQSLVDSSIAFTPVKGGGDWDAQAYAYLKTLPEFAGAVDC